MQDLKEVVEGIVLQYGASLDEEKKVALENRAKVVLEKIINTGIHSLEPSEFYAAWTWGVIPSALVHNKIAFNNFSSDERIEYIYAMAGKGGLLKSVEKAKKEEERREAQQLKLAQREAKKLEAAERKKAQRAAAKPAFNPVLSLEEWQSASREDKARAVFASNGTFKEVSEFYGISNGQVNALKKLGAELAASEDNSPSLFSAEDLK